MSTNVNNITSASAKVDSASRLACNIFCAIEFCLEGMIGGLSCLRGLLVDKYPNRRTV